LVLAFADHFARGPVERSEKRCRAVAFVIMRAAFGMPEFHRQKRLRPIERLDLTLLVTHRVRTKAFSGGSRLQPYNIDSLFNQEGISTILERRLQMRLKVVALPNPVYRGLTHPHSLGQPPCASNGSHLPDVLTLQRGYEPLSPQCTLPYALGQEHPKPLHASVYPSVSPQLHSVDITPAPLSPTQHCSIPQPPRRTIGCSFHDALFGTPRP